MIVRTDETATPAAEAEVPVSRVPGFAVDPARHLFAEGDRHAWFSLYTLLRGLAGSGNNGHSYVTRRDQFGGAGVAYSLAGEGSAITLRDAAPEGVAAAVTRIGRLFPGWALPAGPGDLCDRIDAAYRDARAAKIAAASQW
jgi:hypothetical protein